MASKAINSNSKFNIYASFNLSADDVNTLSLLYAPLIGSDAFLLYMGFNSLLDRKNLGIKDIIHQSFFDSFSYTPTSFIKARNKLEGVGLLLTYVDSIGNYTYVLNAPYSAKNFIYDSPFIFYLKSKLSDDLYDRIMNNFTISEFDKKELKNISKSFDEVFDSEVYNSETMQKFAYILGKNPNSSLKINKNNFDIDKFIKQIEKRFLPYGVTEEFKKDIIQIAFVYQISVDDMILLYSESIDKTGKFSKKMLKDKADLYLKTTRNLETPKLKSKDEDEYSDYISFLDNASPESLLSQLLDDYPINYISTINQVYQISLPRGVLNCMIAKVLKDKGGDMPPFEYFKKMSETWIKDNVLSTADAIKYVTELKESKQNKYSKSKLKGNPIDEENGGFTIL